MASLSEIRSRLAAAENRGSNNTANRSNLIYPHWNIAEGTTATVRFLPDGNSSNPFFWVEQFTIRLPFNGIKGESSNPITVTVPCVEMWGETCPILAEVRPWFKDPSLEELGRKYWKKRQYHFQGFVRENPLAEDQSPENPIRRFAITPQLFNVIKAALMDPELDELPTDYTKGLDFRISKTQKGGYADYNTSSWARRESALSDFERSAIETYGLYDLSSFLPKRPTSEEIKVIHAMFEASVDGAAYDPDQWGAYFKPYGYQGNADAVKTVAEPAPIKEPAAKPAITVESDVAPWEDDVKVAEATFTTPAAEEPKAETTATKSNADDILAMIRARQSQA